MCYTRQKCTLISACEKKIIIIDLRPCKVNFSLVGKNFKTNLNFSSILSFSVISYNINIYLCVAQPSYSIIWSSMNNTFLRKISLVASGVH